MIEFGTNQLSHFIWSQNAIIGAYASTIPFNFGKRTRMLLAGSLTITAGISKEIYDYLAIYPYFNKGDTTLDLISDSIGIISGLFLSYGLSKSYHFIRGRLGRMKRANRIEFGYENAGGEI